MGVTDQGAREARYADAIHHATEQATLGWPQESLRLFVEPIMREVLSVADAEVAAAVSEAQAEIERLAFAYEMEHKGALIYRDRAHAAEAEVERLREGIRALADTIPADLFMLRRAFRALLSPSPAATTGEHEIDRLREGIRALADSWDPPVTTALLQQGFGWDKDMSDMADDLRALLAPSPAATTGEECTSCGQGFDSPACCEGGFHTAANPPMIRPAPVSSGEAATGEAVDPEHCPRSQRKDGKHSWKFDGDDPYIICHYCDEMQDARTGRVVRPAPVVTPSAEGSD